MKAEREKDTRERGSKQVSVQAPRLCKSLSVRVGNLLLTLYISVAAD